MGFYGYNPFAPHSTLAESINLFSVLLSLSFTCPGKNNLTSDIVCKLPALSFIRLIECLFTAPHAVCVLNYFSLPDTANSYFLFRKSSSIGDFLLLVRFRSFNCLYCTLVPVSFQYAIVPMFLSNICKLCTIVLLYFKVKKIEHIKNICPIHSLPSYLLLLAV